MRNASSSLSLLFATALVLLSCPTDYAQERERFVISAKAGGINAVTGRTRVHAPGSAEWEQLTIKDNLEAGDVVKTGVDGRVEMLLNPGSYMRVAENSEFELINNSLDNLEVRLISGTAIVEATGADSTELMINITTPHTKMAIVRRGLYRVNVLPGDATELIVRKGRVLLSDSQIKVKDGKKLIFNGHAFSIAKLEKNDKQPDEFDGWSKERGKAIAQASRRITRRDMSLVLASLRNGWTSPYSRSAYGVWWFHPRLGCYTFLSFFGGWGSPYGSYGNPFYNYYGSYYSGSGYGNTSAGNHSGGSSTSPPSSGNPTPSTPIRTPAPAPSQPTRDFSPGPERHRATPEIRRPRDQ